MSTHPKLSSKKSGNNTSSPSPQANPRILYIDLHLVHEVTSPQAFDGLRMTGRKLRRPDRTIATVDHNVPTSSIEDRLHIVDQIASKQIEALRKNCADFGVELYDVQSPNQGIVHIIGPELGLTKPGMTIVCGDSHTSTHGAFGALAFGIGTSEVEHVMATQTLPQDKPKTFRINVEGTLPIGVTAKDIVLHIIGQIGTAGATGYVVEYAGSAIRALSMEGRMTICNMSIEAGARAGMIAPDATTFAYLKGRRFSPSRGASMGRGRPPLVRTCNRYRSNLRPRTHHRRHRHHPHRKLGHLPRHGHRRQSQPFPCPIPHASEADQKAFERALEYMDLKPARPSNRSTSTAPSSAPAPTPASKTSAPPPPSFAATTSPPPSAPWSSPAHKHVKAQAEKEGLDKVFTEAGFDWREPGCSMCLGMNPDILAPGERCASTTNRNFEGRQGRGGRTHLVSPQMAAAAAITGHFTDIRDWKFKERKPASAAIARL